MKGILILVVFFLLFTSASMIVPSPMFPGNLFCGPIGILGQYAIYLGAILNGVFYGTILWLVFVGISRRLEQEK